MSLEKILYIGRDTFTFETLKSKLSEDTKESIAQVYLDAEVISKLNEKNYRVYIIAKYTGDKKKLVKFIQEQKKNPAIIIYSIPEDEKLAKELNVTHYSVFKDALPLAAMCEKVLKSKLKSK
jgi:rRNA pseudouridine-1189 N-methylase Emg1 (Nep1/Mra1 family)